MDKYISKEEFSKLPKNKMIDNMNELLGSFDIKLSLHKLNVTNKITICDLYTRLMERIEQGEDVTTEVVNILAKRVKDEYKNPEQDVDNEEIVDDKSICSNVKFAPTQSDILTVFDTIKINNHLDECNIDTKLMKYKNVGRGKYLLKRSSEFSVGYDLYLDSCISDESIGLTKNMVELGPFESKTYGTGIAVELPDGYHCELYVRSGLFKDGRNNQDNSELRCKVMLTNGVGVIDNDYRGEILVQLVNVGNLTGYGPSVGERFTQLLIKKDEIFETVEVDELSSTTRGSGGFGSSGK